MSNLTQQIFKCALAITEFRQSSYVSLQKESIFFKRKTTVLLFGRNRNFKYKFSSSNSRNLILNFTKLYFTVLCMWPLCYPNRFMLYIDL